MTGYEHKIITANELVPKKYFTIFFDKYYEVCFKKSIFNRR